MNAANKPRHLPADPQPDPVKVGQAVRATRQRLNISQAELARRLGMRPPPLNNIEKGRALASTPILCRLAAALKLTPDQLLYPDPYTLDPDPNPDHPAVYAQPPADPEPPAPRPRRLIAGLTRAPGEIPIPHTSLLNRIGDLADAYLQLEATNGATLETTIPLHLPLTSTPDGMAALADKVRRLLDIAQAVVFDYLECFENAGLRVLFLPMTKRWDSLSCYDARTGTAFLFIATRRNPEKQLFRLIYELGRVYLHTHRNAIADAPAPVPPSPDMLDTEHAARQFAAAFLMPEPVMRATIAKLGIRPGEWTQDLLLSVKHRFGVSAEAFCIRLEELQLIEPELALQRKTQIRDYYARKQYAEPGFSRRILAVNGRLADLIRIAAGRPQDPAAAQALNAIHNAMQRNKIQMPANA